MNDQRNFYDHAIPPNGIMAGCLQSTYNRTKIYSHQSNPYLLPDGSQIPPARHSTAYIDRDCVSLSRANQLERNRIAANKCREKKKLSHTRMTLALDAQSNRNKALKNEVAGLREELWSLKNQLFNHSLCENKIVDSYLGEFLAAQQQETPTESPKCPSLSFSASTCDGESRSSEDICAEVSGDCDGKELGFNEEDLFRSFLDLSSL